MNTLSLGPHWFCFSNKYYGAIQVLRTAVGRRRVCVLNCTEKSVMKTYECTEKKRYVTLEWPITHTAVSFFYPKKYS